jgi:hypothetical protein
MLSVLLLSSTSKKTIYNNEFHIKLHFLSILKPSTYLLLLLPYREMEDEMKDEAIDLDLPYGMYAVRYLYYVEYNVL